jgi:hypothetical protein
MSLSKNGNVRSSIARNSGLLSDDLDDLGGSPPANGVGSGELRRSLAEIKGQAQFLLYLADQIEESLDQLHGEADACHGAFLGKVLGMYSSQLESKHQGLGEKIAEACQELYVTVRERDMV